MPCPRPPSPAGPVLHRPIRWSSGLVAGLLLLALNGCSDSTAPAEPEEDQDRILFVSNRYGIYSVYDIFRANVDGTGVENLTLAPAQSYKYLRLSPDGTRVAFMSSRVGCYNIWVMNTDGTSPVQLTGVEADERCNNAPHWSPDGRRIAFMSSREPASWQVYVMNADGSDPRKVSIVPGLESFSAGPLGWSPDGRVVFYTNASDTIYTVEPDGSGLEVLFDRSGIGSPCWSPDGSRLAFVWNREGVSGLHVRDADGTERELARTTDTEPGSFVGLSAASPWSPDGARIAFHVGSGGKAQIHVIDADGSDLRQITDEPGHSSFFDGWSPDGTRLAFTRYRPDAADVYVVNADGSGLVNLTASASDDRYALWLPGR